MHNLSNESVARLLGFDSTADTIFAYNFPVMPMDGESVTLEVYKLVRTYMDRAHLGEESVYIQANYPVGFLIVQPYRDEIA